MADSKIVITASLNTVETVETIKKDLKTVEGMLESNPLQLFCTISDSSIKQIQSQLDSLTKGLTINANVNAQSIQQSINQVTKSQKIEVDITTKINKSTLQKQAKEMEEILQLFDRGGEQSGRAELASLLEEYQKAFRAENYEGTVNALDKIITFTREHQRTVEVTNEELKAQQERVQEVLKDMQKLYITTEQLEAVQRELTGSKRNAQGLTTEAENFLNNYLGKGKWSDDPSKFTNVATHYWSTFVDSVNNIIHGSGNKYMELLNEGDIVEGLRNFVDFMGKSADATNEYMRSNALTAEQWADSVASAITKVTGTNLAEVANWNWVDILSDETVEHTEQNAQKMAQAYSTVQAAKDLYKDDKSVKSVTSDWVFDANKNITGFTVNINKLNGEVERLNHTITETGEVKFLGGSGSDKGVEKQAETMIKFVNEYTAKLNSLKAKVGEQFAPNITATLGDDMQKTTVTFDSFEKKLAELLKGNGNIGELRSEFTALDGVVKSLGAQLRGSDTSLNQFTNAINNARKFDNDLKALEIDYNNLNEKQRESETLTKSLADAQKKLSDLRNTQQTEGYTEKWITQYREASIALTQFTADLKLAKKLEQQDTSSVAHKQAVALAELRDAYREITSLSQKLYQSGTTGEYKTELERQISAQDEIIYKTMQRAKEEGLINQEFKQQIQLYATLQNDELSLMQSKLRTTEAAKATTEQARQQVEALKERNQLYSDLTKWIDKYLQSLNAFNNSSIAKKNSGNSNVASQVEENTKLIEQLEKIKASLSQGYDATKLKSLYQEFSKLSDPIKQAAANSAALKQSLLDTGLTQNVSNQIRNLTNQVSIFANTNRKATESLRTMRDGQTTFADEWQRIKTALSSGTLDDAALKRLAQDFRNFKGEADSAGLTVNRFFQSMQSQLRMVLQRWISLYAVIGYIRKMIDAVKELDNAMINLRRVTDETDAGYQRFLEDANKLARQMKTTTSSLVEMSYQWSKLGFEMKEALELSKASTIFMRVADVGQDQALSNLVTSLKAFRLEASQTMDVVDKLDKLNNEYAVSASGLGQGLERSASAMAMTGNSLEETLAMLTGAGEITQNLENTGNALRVISLR